MRFTGSPSPAHVERTEHMPQTARTEQLVAERDSLRQCPLQAVSRIAHGSPSLSHWSVWMIQWNTAASSGGSTGQASSCQ